MSDFLIVVAAKYLIAVPVLVLLAYVVFLRGKTLWRLIYLSVVSLPVAYVLGRLAGLIYTDPRPFVVGHFEPLIAHAADNGFPSDHTLLAATIAMIVLYINKRVGYVLWLTALVIGLVRVFAGVHHVSDIVASMLIAFVAVAGCKYALDFFGKW
jgi:undecaprenyl-diphosphatase